VLSYTSQIWPCPSALVCEITGMQNKQMSPRVARPEAWARPPRLPENACLPSHVMFVGLCLGLPSFRGMPPDVVGVYPVLLSVYGLPYVRSRHSLRYPPPKMFAEYTLSECVECSHHVMFNSSAPVSTFCIDIVQTEGIHSRWVRCCRGFTVAKICARTKQPSPYVYIGQSCGKEAV
jgi:hypothetical protein